MPWVALRIPWDDIHERETFEVFLKVSWSQEEIYGIGKCKERAGTWCDCKLREAGIQAPARLPHASLPAGKTLAIEP